MREMILVELLPVLDRFILPFRLRVLSQSKMFLTTSSKEVWLLGNFFSEYGFSLYQFFHVLVFYFIANLGLSKMLEFLASRRGCLVLSLLFMRRLSSKF